MPETIAALRGLADTEHAVIELDVGVDLFAQPLDQLLIAVLDRIQTDVAVDVHHVILQRIEAAGVVALGRKIRTRHHLEEAFGDGIGHLAIQHRLGILERPRMFVVVRTDAFIILRRRDQLRAALAERLDRRRGLRSILAAHAVDVVKQFAVELHLLCVHRNGLQAEMLDQFPQRIGAEHRVIVDLGDARFVHCIGRIELAGDDLAADALSGFENGDLAKGAQFLAQMPRGHQTARPAADDCEIQHLQPSITDAV